MNAFTRRDGRRTVYSGTEGELIADCDIITVKAHHGGRTRTYDLNQKASSALHMGADLEIVEDFIAAVKDPSHRCAVSIADALESHRLCFLAG